MLAILVNFCIAPLTAKESFKESALGVNIFVWKIIGVVYVESELDNSSALPIL